MSPGFVLPADYGILGVFQGRKTKIQDPTVGNVTLIFFSTSYFISDSVCR